MTRKRSQPPTFSEEKKQHIRKRQILLGSFLLLLGFLMTVSFISFLFHHQSDQSTLELFFDKEVQSQNILNKIGALVSHFFIYQLFGISVFIVPYLLCYWGYLLFFGRVKKDLIIHCSWAMLYLICLSVFFGFYHIDSPLLGGLVGYEINSFLVAYLGKVGVSGFLIFLLIAILVIQWKFTPEKAILFFRSIIKKEETTHEVGIENSLDLEIDDFMDKTDQDVELRQVDPIEVENSTSEDEVTMEVETYKEEESLTDNLAQSLVEKHGFFDPKLELSKYRFPNHDLLKDYGENSITIDQEELELNKNKIVETLKNYNIGISKIKATVGPTVTLYEIVPEAGIRISKIKNLEDDIALSLSALGIRIIAPIPGKGTIGIEVPNQKPSIVSMRSVITSNKFQTAEMELPLAMGKNISNETFVVDLTKMPHLLMAGATGQGKSVGLNAVLTSLNHQTGTDRVHEVFKDRLNCGPNIIINLQGDMPNIEPKAISNLVNYMKKNQCDIATLAALLHPDHVYDPNVVKVFTKHIPQNKIKEAIKESTFSPVSDFDRGITTGHNDYGYHHIGIYGFTDKALIKYVNLKRSKLELERDLEQMRALENNMKIHVGYTESSPLSVDTEEDLIEIRKIMEKSS